MTSIRAFNKILSHQENLKNEAQLTYKESVDAFEEIATKLYQLLKKKEEVQKEYNYYLSSSGTVTTLATHYAYIEQINQRIQKVEVEVNAKRRVMNEKQDKLTEQYVEVKKFEKIIDHKTEKMKAHENYKENQTMDEVSMRQYFNHGNR